MVLKLKAKNFVINDHVILKLTVLLSNTSLTLHHSIHHTPKSMFIKCSQHLPLHNFSFHYLPPTFYRITSTNLPCTTPYNLQPLQTCHARMEDTAFTASRSATVREAGAIGCPGCVLKHAAREDSLVSAVIRVCVDVYE